ncbi:MAG: hypothetical protein E6K61_04035 [Nitrospirae bacterium]|nr:MAG: hypothetical protein E6K61_04035 [Nitrospirota bacterium]
MACGRPLPRLSRHPFHGSPEWKPSGIPVAVVCDHGAVGQYRLSSSGCRVGTPPHRQRTLQTACHLLIRLGVGALVGARASAQFATPVRPSLWKVLWGAG